MIDQSPPVACSRLMRLLKESLLCFVASNACDITENGSSFDLFGNSMRRARTL